MEERPETRVLVVDDDAVTREALAELLEREGCVVEAVEDGELALRRFVAGPAPHVLILDLLMPGRDGASLLEELRRADLLRGTRTLVVTGLSGRFLQRALEVDAVLTKPVQPRELLSTMWRSLELPPPSSRRPSPAG